MTRTSFSRVERANAPSQPAPTAGPQNQEISGATNEANPSPSAKRGRKDREEAALSLQGTSRRRRQGDDLNAEAPFFQRASQHEQNARTDVRPGIPGAPFAFKDSMIH